MPFEHITEQPRNTNVQLTGVGNGVSNYVSDRPVYSTLRSLHNRSDYEYATAMSNVLLIDVVSSNGVCTMLG